MSNMIRMALVQFPRDRHNKEKNLAAAREYLAEINSVDFVIFPEAWVGAVSLDENEVAEILAMFGEHALRGGFTAIVGGLFVKRGERAVSIAHVVGPDGNLVGYTEKIFPSLPVGERAFCDPGERLPIYEINGTRFGVLVCVDLFYPELARSLATRGARIIFNPSNIPKNRIPLWRTLLSARAAENTLFTIFACNTLTTYPDQREVAGHCMTHAPWGDTLFDAGEDAGVHYAEIDLDQTNAVRERWPYLADIEQFDGVDGDCVIRKNGNGNAESE